MKLRRLHLTFVASYLTVLAVAMLAAGPGAAAQGGEGEAVDGAQVFQSICAACHQPDGQGLPGAFPPLVGHARELYEAAGGPRYLAYVVLFGLQGQITAAGQTFDGQMPSFYDLSDAQIAAVLDHVLTELGEAGQPEGYEPVTPEAVAAARKAALSPALVHQRRPELAAADGAQPGAELADAHYAAAQVERALPVYRRLCVECHGEDLGGRPHRRSAARRRRLPPEVGRQAAVGALHVHVHADAAGQPRLAYRPAVRRPARPDPQPQRPRGGRRAHRPRPRGAGRPAGQAELSGRRSVR